MKKIIFLFTLLVLLSGCSTKGISNNDIDKIGSGWYRMAEFLHVELPYHDTDSFVDYMDRMRGKTIFAESSAK